jgi:hypothetical protein
MDNSPAHSCHSKVSLLQQSYHVGSDPKIHHHEQVDTSEEEDKERESSISHDDAKVYFNTKLLCAMKVT